MKISIKALFLGVFALSSVSMQANAIGLSFGDDDKKSSGNASNSQEAIVKTYTSSATDILTSQALLLEAFGKQTEAEQVRASAEAMQSGSVTSKDELKKHTEVSEKASKEIAKSMESSNEMSDESKKLYADALPPYASGLKKLYVLKDQFAPFLDSAKSEISGAGIMGASKVKSKLEAGMYLATSGPDYISNLYNTSEQLLTFAQDKDIKVPEDATSALSDL